MRLAPSLVLALAVLFQAGCDSKSKEGTAETPGASESTADQAPSIEALEAAHPGLFLKPTPEQVAEATALHNPVCPTDGEKIGSMGPAVPVVYKGKVVDLCCAGCPAEFGSDPDKYLALAEAGKGPE